jgi:hypothetical protein
MCSFSCYILILIGSHITYYMNLYIEKNVDDRRNGHPVPIPVRVRTKENRYFFLAPQSHLFLVAWTIIQQGTYIGTLYSMAGGLCQSHIRPCLVTHVKV